MSKASGRRKKTPPAADSSEDSTQSRNKHYVLSDKGDKRPPNPHGGFRPRTDQRPRAPQPCRPMLDFEDPTGHQNLRRNRRTARKRRTPAPARGGLATRTRKTAAIPSATAHCCTTLKRNAEDGLIRVNVFLHQREPPSKDQRPPKTDGRRTEAGRDAGAPERVRLEKRSNDGIRRKTLHEDSI